MAAITYSGSGDWITYNGTTANTALYSTTLDVGGSAGPAQKKSKTELDLLDERVNELRVRL